MVPSWSAYTLAGTEQATNPPSRYLPSCLRSASKWPMLSSRPMLLATCPHRDSADVNPCASLARHHNNTVQSHACHLVSTDENKYTREEHADKRLPSIRSHLAFALRRRVPEKGSWMGHRGVGLRSSINCASCALVSTGVAAAHQRISAGLRKQVSLLCDPLRN